MCAGWLVGGLLVITTPAPCTAVLLLAAFCHAQPPLGGLKHPKSLPTCLRPPAGWKRQYRRDMAENTDGPSGFPRRLSWQGSWNGAEQRQGAQGRRDGKPPPQQQTGAVEPQLGSRVSADLPAACPGWGGGISVTDEHARAVSAPPRLVVPFAHAGEPPPLAHSALHPLAVRGGAVRALRLPPRSLPRPALGLSLTVDTEVRNAPTRVAFGCAAGAIDCQYRVRDLVTPGTRSGELDAQRWSPPPPSPPSSPPPHPVGRIMMPANPPGANPVASGSPIRPCGFCCCGRSITHTTP